MAAKNPVTRRSAVVIALAVGALFALATTVGANHLVDCDVFVSVEGGSPAPTAAIAVDERLEVHGSFPQGDPPPAESGIFVRLEKDGVPPRVFTNVEVDADDHILLTIEFEPGDEGHWLITAGIENSGCGGQARVTVFSPAEPGLGTIHVTKTIEDFAGETETFTFVLAGGPSESEFVLGHDESETLHLPPGEYTLTEIVPAGWEVVVLGCGVERSGSGWGPGPEADASLLLPLLAGEIKVCSFVNAHEQVPLQSPPAQEGPTPPALLPDTAANAPPSLATVLGSVLLALIAGVGLAVSRRSRRFHLS
jgi:hypothetical protein